VSCVVSSLNVGLARRVDINGRAVMTAIGKRGVTGCVAVNAMGLEGDEQADLTVHGGLSKAVYAYPSEHYGFWQTVRAQAKVSLWDEALPPGFMGENLTLSGLLESEVFIGDVLRFPNCQLAVSEPRYPCFKFNAAMGFKHASQLMAANGAGSIWRCGCQAASKQAKRLRSCQGRARSASPSCFVRAWPSSEAEARLKVTPRC
jgi:MOSC domain-containing protein YiiM